MSIVALPLKIRNLPAAYSPGLFYPKHVCNYLDLLNAADVASGNRLGLERPVTELINKTISDMVAAGLLSVSNGVISQSDSLIKASCLMCGARSLSGSLVPLVGPAPTNFNFTSLAYNRKNGSQSNGTTQYISTNFASNTVPQNDFSCSIFVNSYTFPTSGVTAMMGDSNITVAGSVHIGRINDSGVWLTRCRSFGFKDWAGTTFSPGLYGVSRSSASAYIGMIANVTNTVSVVSDGALGNAMTIYARGGGSLSEMRASFYHVGRAVNQAVLSSIITTHMNTLSALSI